MTGIEPSNERMPAAVARGERWLIALDVDGTLIHEDETIGEAVLEAVDRVVAAGHEVTLATGRSWETAAAILRRFSLTPDFVVCSNGAVTLARDASDPSGYRREFVETFDPSEVLNAIQPHLPHGAYMVEDALGFRRFTEGVADWSLENAEKVDFADLAGFPASRVVVVSPSHDEAEFLEVVERMGLHRVSYSIGWTAWLDIAPDGVNKATAVERVRELLGIPRDRVMAVGDGRNDIEMLEWASASGRGVAMGQAPKDVLEAGNEVTATVDDDGLAIALGTV